MDQARRGGYVFWEDSRWEDYSLKDHLTIEWLNGGPFLSTLESCVIAHDNLINRKSSVVAA